MQVADQGTPEFPAAMKDAEYLVGFARESLGAEFYRGAPKLKLIQLISAGYDRLDIAAARQAKVPVANNGGSNSVAVAEHTLMLILAVYKKLAWHHHNVITGKWRVGDFSQTRTYELALQVALASGQIAAAGLDVMVEEPPEANHPLFGLENITITPHSAGPTWENWAKAFRNAFDNVQRVAAGRKPLWVIPELQDLI